MVSANAPHSPNILIREAIIFSKDDHELILPSNLQQLKQAKKASTISLREDDTIKTGRSSKCRLALLPVTQEKPDNVNLNQNNLSSTNKELKTEHKTNHEEFSKYITEYSEDETLPHSKVCSLENDDEPEDVIHSATIEQLNLSVDIPKKVLSLEEKLAEDHELDVLGIMNLSSMHLTDDNIPSIIQRAFVEHKRKCIGLILRDNGLTSRGVRMLVDALLAIRTKLKYLSFSNNAAIGDQGIEHLTRLLKINRSITFLALPNTGITDRGVRLLADILCNVGSDSSCPPLEKLHISFNKLITDGSLDALIQILEQNQTLKVLSVQHCSLSDKARRRLRHAGTKKKKKNFILSE